jgi:16S rRNA (guanine527-N7)-methyltransferase
MGNVRENDRWPEDLLRAGAERLGVRLQPAQVEAFGRYLAELLRWSVQINLTGLRRPEEIVRAGFLDSLSCLALLPRDARRALDIGPGAGFPSVPLKIARPHLALTLVEASRKKASFLRHVTRCLALSGVRVVQDRAERLARNPEEARTYDVAFARAVAPPEEQALLALPFLRPGGVFVAQVSRASILPETGRWPAGEAFDVAGSVVFPREIGLPGRRVLALRRRT